LPADLKMIFLVYLRSRSKLGMSSREILAMSDRYLSVLCPHPWTLELSRFAPDKSEKSLSQIDPI
jgi:hypothetical protein